MFHPHSLTIVRGMSRDILFSFSVIINDEGGTTPIHEHVGLARKFNYFSLEAN
nr:MAG TPA: hypothetical protein [Caudoviricetes sp.]